MIKKAYADTSGGQCHYRYQSGASDPIVFLHQTPSSSQMFEAIMRRLQDYSTYAIDTPGLDKAFIQTMSLLWQNTLLGWWKRFKVLQ